MGLEQGSRVFAFFSLLVAGVMLSPGGRAGGGDAAHRPTSGSIPSSHGPAQIGGALSVADLETSGASPGVRPRFAALQAFSRLPPTFVPNAGQLPPQVRYSSHGPGYAIYLTPRRLVLSLGSRMDDPPTAAKTGLESPREPLTEGAVGGRARGSMTLALELVGSRGDVEIRGVEQATGIVNIFRGDDPTRWRTRLPTYSNVLYSGAWPGVDLAVRGAPGELEYELVLAPGARLEDVRLAYSGASRLRIDSAGDLVIETPFGPLSDSRPVSHQSIGGRLVAVPTRYVLLGAGPEGQRYGFAVDEGYDPRLPLVIDPGLSYSTFLGGTSFDAGLSIAVDGDGNAYVAGESGDFPTTAGAFDPTFNGIVDAFVAKLSADGSALVYSTYLGGDLVDRAVDLALDPEGNAVVTGWTNSANFPTTAGAFDRTPNGGYETFVAKLDPSGSRLLYSTLFGGAMTDLPKALALDSHGAVHVVGATNSTDLPVTPGAYDRSFNGSDDIYVLALDATGSSLVYCTYIGAEEYEFGYDVAVDGRDRPIVGGFTTSRGFPATAVFGPKGREDVFVLKLDASGSSLLYSAVLGGRKSDYGNAIAVDERGSAYVAGSTYSPDFPVTPGAYDTSRTIYSDAFVARLDASGTALLYATLLGGASYTDAIDLALGPGGRASVTGYTSSPDFPTTPDAPDRTYGGVDDVFVTTLDATGSRLEYSTFVGGTNFDKAEAIAVDRAGNAYVTGWTQSVDFPTTRGAFDRTINSVADGFVVKLRIPPERRCGGRPVTLLGTEGDDALTGTDGADVIDGLGGNDVIMGLGGDDFLCGGTGSDGLVGGSGDDHLEGGDGEDDLEGDAGDDVLDGGAAGDVLSGGSGRDALAGGSGDDVLDGGTDPGERGGLTPGDVCDGGSHVAEDRAVNCETVFGVP